MWVGDGVLLCLWRWFDWYGIFVFWFIVVCEIVVVYYVGLLFWLFFFIVIVGFLRWMIISVRCLFWFLVRLRSSLVRVW